MTWSAHSISESQLQASGCASYTYLLYSSKPYIRSPFFQFSELLIDDASINGGTEPAFPFLTGHGGYLQIFTHGFTGLRPRHDAFYLDPSLPPQLGNGGVQVRGMKWQGAVFDVDIQLRQTTIHRRKTDKSSSTGPVNVRIGGSNSKAGDYLLKMGQSLIVPTRRPDVNAQGNHALCQSVSSEERYTTGRFPLSIVDGSPSSVWQPASPHPASVIVDLGRQVKDLSNVEITWGCAPAKGFAISIQEKGIDANSWKEVVRIEDVAISSPYEPEKIKEVRMPQLNKTISVFESIQQGEIYKIGNLGYAGRRRRHGCHCCTV